MHVNRRHFLALGSAAPILLLLGNKTQAQSQSEIYSENGVAIDGTDAVAYFLENRPVAGNPDITHDWMGVTWRFANVANRDAFMADPAAFAPQFGGYCAWAVSQGYVASTTPEAWKIVDGKLYLNFSRRIQRRWEADIPGHITRANANWPTVLG